MTEERSTLPTAAPPPAPPERRSTLPAAPPELIITIVPVMNTPPGLSVTWLPPTLRLSMAPASSTSVVPAFRWISVPAS